MFLNMATYGSGALQQLHCDRFEYDTLGDHFADPTRRPMQLRVSTVTRFGLANNAQNSVHAIAKVSRNRKGCSVKG
jgi:hypothetical protein